MTFMDCKIQDLAATPEALVFKVEISSNRALPTLREIERSYALRLMEKYQNKYRVAQIMGITVKTLYNKLDEWGETERFRVYSPASNVPRGTKE